MFELPRDIEQPLHIYLGTIDEKLFRRAVHRERREAILELLEKEVLGRASHVALTAGHDLGPADMHAAIAQMPTPDQIVHEHCGPSRA